MYLSNYQTSLFAKLLKAFFTLPYSTDLDGKDAETIIRIVKDIQGRISRRKELFDIVDGKVGYSVRTLRKPLAAQRVDLQEQRFCDVEEIRRMMVTGGGQEIRQGEILISYMRNRIIDQMKKRDVEIAKSLILLKDWNKDKTHFSFRYWEENFLEYIDHLWNKNEKGEIEWVLQAAGIHARDRMRQDKSGKNVRLLRMHHKHNQIFTDHDIPNDAVVIEFDVERLTWKEVADLLQVE